MAASELQRLTGKRILEEFGFPDLKENYRPDWMQSEKGERLELDFYIPSLRIAIEVQGQQHFTFTPRFHSTYECFLAQQKRDSAKLRLCEIHGVQLWEVSNVEDLQLVLEKIRIRIPDTAKTKAPKFLSDAHWDSILMTYIKIAMRSTPEGRIRWGHYKGKRKIARVKLAKAKKSFFELNALLGSSENPKHKNAIDDAKKQLDRRIKGLKDSRKFEKVDFVLVSRGVMRFLSEHRPPVTFIANHPLISTQAEDKDAYTYKVKFLVE